MIFGEWHQVSYRVLKMAVSSASIFKYIQYQAVNTPWDFPRLWVFVLLLVTPHEVWEMEGGVFLGQKTSLHHSSWRLPQVWPEMKVSRRQDQAYARMQWRATKRWKEEEWKTLEDKKVATEVPFEASYLFGQFSTFSTGYRQDHKNIKHLPSQKSLSRAQPPAPWSWQIQLRHVQDSTTNSKLQA